MLSISQLCDKNFDVAFKAELCCVSCLISNNIIFTGHRNRNVYMVDLDNLSMNKMQCLVVDNSNDSSWLWHRRLAHASMDLISKLCRKDLVKGLPKLKF